MDSDRIDRIVSHVPEIALYALGIIWLAPSVVLYPLESLPTFGWQPIEGIVVNQQEHENPPLFLYPTFGYPCYTLTWSYDFRGAHYETPHEVVDGHGSNWDDIQVGHT